MMKNIHNTFWHVGFGVCIALLSISLLVVGAYYTHPEVHAEPSTTSHEDAPENFETTNIFTEQAEQIVGGLPVLENRNYTLAAFVQHDVPFTSQAPLGNWDDPRQDYGCEEASLLMSIHWVLDKPLTPEQSLEHITTISDWELEHYGEFHDASTADTYRLLKEYFNYDNAVLYYDVTEEMIKAELNKGRILVAPTDGRKAYNPNYSGDGPPKHMLVITGYDDATEEFITNDPGTRNGEAFRYSYDNFMYALSDYDTGHDEPRTEERTAIISIGK